MSQNTPLLILCGGRSTRMGSPKPLLRYHGQTLIARQISHAQRPVWLAADTERYPNTECAIYLPDQLPNKQGALSAILPALTLAKNQGFSGIYIMSCDTLILPEQLIALLNTAPDKTIFKQGITALQDGEQFLPLLAHWSVAVSGSLKAAVDTDFRRVQHFVKAQPYQTVDLPKEWSALCHFNTPDEFELAVATADNL